jgi:hypothetical protein
LEPFDDDHAPAAGIDRNDWEHKQFASVGEVLGALAGREEAIVADAVKACGQHVDEKAADELVGGECHHLVAVGTFDPVVLPLEGDAIFVVIGFRADFLLGNSQHGRQYL